MPPSVRDDTAASTPLQPFRSSIEWTPRNVTALYLVLGLLALFVFDVVLVRILDDPLLATVQATKGAVEVVATAGFIFVLTRRSRAQLRETNESLERQREELGVLHRVLRHDLRNALTVIAGTATHLRKQSSLDGTEEDCCERIERRAERLAGMVEQASRIRRITERESQRVVVDLDRAVHDAVDGVDTSDVDVTVDLPADESVAVNPLFPDALRELVTNAVEHAGDAPTLDVRGSGANGTVTLTIEDDGPGIPDRVRSVFDRGEYDQLLHLEGMGLWFAYWTVTDGNGRFEIEDGAEGGTRILLTLDRAAALDVESAPPKPA